MLKKLKAKVKLLKAELSVLVIAYKDPRTPFLPKLIIGLTVGYMLSPIDLIPDFIPVLGLLDDLILVPLLIQLSIKLIPEIVIADARQEILNNPREVKKENWIFALIIIALWIVVAVFVGRWLVTRSLSAGQAGPIKSTHLNSSLSTLLVRRPVQTRNLIP